MPDSQALNRDDEPAQAFYAGVSRSHDIDEDSNLYATYPQEKTFANDEGTRGQRTTSRNGVVRRANRTRTLALTRPPVASPALAAAARARASRNLP